METRAISGITLLFDRGEQDTADLIAGTCAKAVQLIDESWGLKTPADCRIYVMTSWLRFVFHSAPWHWRILLGVLFPLWSLRAKRMWSYAGGWTQRFGRRVVIGVKPPRLGIGRQKHRGSHLHQGDRYRGEDAAHHLPRDDARLLITSQVADVAERRHCDGDGGSPPREANDQAGDA